MIVNQSIPENFKEKYNIFLALLRMYLEFIVVNSHCLDPSKLNNKIIIKLLYNKIPVPIFFIISFYFFFNLLSSRNIKKIKQRFERLLIPYFIWPIFIWIINNFLKFFLKWETENSINDLKMQLLTGHWFMRVLWFQYNLVFITLIVVIFEFLIEKNKELIFINLEIIAYFFQYSNLNYQIFSKYSLYKKYTLGRFLEVIPFCITGYILASLKIIHYLKKHSIMTIYFFLTIIWFVIKYNVFIEIKGFLYQGIRLQIISILIFIIFSLFPSQKIKNKNIIKTIRFITNNTSGIYFLHYSISNYLNKYIILIKNKTLFGCIIIYIICYFISFFGLRIFGKTKLRNLFQ